MTTMTPDEVEGHRARAVALIAGAKLICERINGEGYYFADEPVRLCNMALDELIGQSLSEIDRRYGEILRRNQQDDVEAYRDLQRREKRDFVEFGQ